MARASSLFLLLIPALASAQPPLPQSVYDQFADPSATNIRMPQGAFKLSKNLPAISRSNVKVDFGGGCKLVLDPATFGNEMYPIQVNSVSRNVIFGQSPNGGVFRRLSQLSGEIKPGTTQLTMIEKVDVQPGETVLVWAGVDKFDPVEPYGHIPATVASVSVGGVITFTKSLGRDIPNFGSLDGLKAATADALRYKVMPWGQWPDNSNYSKGFGTSHGMERFNGGMVSNVTITGNPTFDIVAGNMLPNGSWLVSTTAVNGLTINGLTVNNPVGNVLFHWRSFGVKVSGINITGQGKSKVWNTRIQDAGVIGIWGGDDLRFERININAKDVTLISTEARPSRVAIKDLTYKCEFTSTRDYSSSPQILGFYSLQDTPKIDGASFDVTWTGGSKPGYQTYANMLFDGKLQFAGPSLQLPFDWGYSRKHQFDGTMTIGGVEYGPQQMKTEVIAVPYVQPTATFRLPMNQGLFLQGRFRVKVKGDLATIHDNMKTSSYANALSGEWIPFDEAGFGAWYSLEAGDDSLARYRNASFFFTFANTTARAGAVVEFNYTYLPKK